MQQRRSQGWLFRLVRRFAVPGGPQTPLSVSPKGGRKKKSIHVIHEWMDMGGLFVVPTRGRQQRSARLCHKSLASQETCPIANGRRAGKGLRFVFSK